MSLLVLFPLPALPVPPNLHPSPAEGAICVSGNGDKLSQKQTHPFLFPPASVPHLAASPPGARHGDEEHKVHSGTAWIPIWLFL